MAGIDGRFDVVGDIWHALTRNLKYGEIISADISGSASAGVGVVVDEDGLSGAGGHVVVVVAGDGEVVDGFGSSGCLDRHHGGGVAVGGVEGVAFVEVRGWCVAAVLDVERVGGRGLDGAAGGGDPQGGDLLVGEGLFHGRRHVLAGGGVVGEDLFAGLDLADGFGGAVGHEDGGVGCEAAVAGDAGDVGQGPAGAAAEGSLACALADGLGEPGGGDGLAAGEVLEAVAGAAVDGSFDGAGEDVLAEAAGHAGGGSGGRGGGAAADEAGRGADGAVAQDGAPVHGAVGRFLGPDAAAGAGEGAGHHRGADGPADACAHGRDTGCDHGAGGDVLPVVGQPVPGRARGVLQHPVRGLLVGAQVVLGHRPQPGRVGQPDRIITRERVRVGRPRGPGDGFEGIDRQERPRGGVVDPGAPSS